MKHLILLLVLAFGVMGTAAAQVKSLVVWMTNGEKVTYALDALPKTTFTSNELVIVTIQVEVSYPLHKVQKYTYSDEVTGVENVQIQNGLQQDGNVFTFFGLEKDAQVAVYAVDGKLMAQKKVRDGQPLVLSLERLPQGVYVIKANDVDYKVMKR